MDTDQKKEDLYPLLQPTSINPERHQEIEEHKEPEPNHFTESVDKPKVHTSALQAENEMGPIQKQKEVVLEWKQEKQLHPTLTKIFFAIGLVVFAVFSFYSKMMFHYYHQNASEAFYAVNTLNLIFFIVIIKVQYKRSDKRQQKVLDNFQTINHTKASFRTNKAEAFDIFSIAKEDRLTFVFIAVTIVIGLGFYVAATAYIDIHYFSLVNIISLGAVTPAVFNVHLRYWMAYKCKIKNYIELPSGCGLCLDFFNFLLVIVGTIILALQFGTDTSILRIRNIEGEVIKTVEQFKNLVGILMAFASGLFLGVGLS